MFIKNVISKISHTKILTLIFFTIVASDANAQSVTPVNTKPWTLESSVAQAMSASPELKKSIAELGSRQADIDLSSMWPEPSIEFRVDNKLGQDDGSGGYDLTDITISQPIPISRIKHQESAANASLESARFSQQMELLKVQNRVSKIFHQLQFASAELELAEKQLELANKLNGQTGKNSNGVVIRYLTPLEKMRLSIIREEARQAASSAEGEYREVLSEFEKLLGIDIDIKTTVSELQPIEKIPDIKYLNNLQESHAQLSSQQQQVLAANHEIDVARSSQIADPTVSLSRSVDSFDSGRDDVYSIMFNVQIPLGDRKNKAASKAGYKASQESIELQLLKRELKINLNRSYTHLHHLVEQAEEYKKKVLQPAKKMLELTRKGFNSGELNILSLVDANNTYYEARLSYLELLYQAWVELAEVNLFSGQLISETKVSLVGGGQ